MNQSTERARWHEIVITLLIYIYWLTFSMDSSVFIGSTEPESPNLWLDRIARMLGFGWLSERIPGDLPPSYLYTYSTIRIY